MKQISNDFKDLFAVNVYDSAYNTIHFGIYQGTFEEIKQGLMSLYGGLYGGERYTLEISHCVSDELPCFEEEL